MLGDDAMISTIDTLLETAYAQEQAAADTWRRILEPFVPEDSLAVASNPREMDLAGTSGVGSGASVACLWKTKEYSFDIIGLHEEINDFYEYIRPKPCEVRMRLEVINNLKAIINSKWPEAQVYVFGSVQTHLFLPTSDVDVVVWGQWQSLPPLFTLEEEIKRADIADAHSILVLDKAKVPIIKLTHKVTRLKVDISFNTESGIQSVRVTRHFIQVYPILPKLLFVIKHFLTERGLNEVYTGGIGSYSLVLLIVSFLQLHPRKAATDEDTNLGVLLIEFFELYGRHFNYRQTGIEVREGGRYFPKSEWIHPQSLSDGILCVVDPVVPTDNTARGSYNILRVKLAFEHAHVVLSQAVLHREKHIESRKTVLGLIVSVTDKAKKHREWVSHNWTNDPIGAPPQLPTSSPNQPSFADFLPPFLAQPPPQQQWYPMQHQQHHQVPMMIPYHPEHLQFSNAGNRSSMEHPLSPTNE